MRPDRMTRRLRLQRGNTVSVVFDELPGERLDREQFLGLRQDTLARDEVDHATVRGLDVARHVSDWSTPVTCYLQILVRYGTRRRHRHARQLVRAPT
jgi:hypothetical protein